jgi:uncharacterized protein (DUF4415 family)
MPDPQELHLQPAQYSVADEKTEDVAVKRKRAPGGGRKPKQEGTLYVPVSMRLHPKAIEWAKAEAKKRGIGYQSLINEILLEQIAY